MHLVMDDLIHADVIEFTRPSSALVSGLTLSSFDENLKACFSEIGLELVEYGGAIRMPIDSIHIGADGERRTRDIRFQVAGEHWLKQR